MTSIAPVPVRDGDVSVDHPEEVLVFQEEVAMPVGELAHFNIRALRQRAE